jgi:hypothetical protein
LRTLVSLRAGVVTLSGVVEDIKRRVEEERARIEAEYREVLRNSVAFEKKIRNRWREKNRRKNVQVAKLESRVTQLEKELETLRADLEEDVMADRETKERKLIALMVNDLGVIDVKEPEMVKMEEEVRSLPGEELDRTLVQRLDLPYPVDAEVLDRALARVAEPEHPSKSGPGGFTGAPDMSHEPRPEERQG